jgi:hypothetical protein
LFSTLQISYSNFHHLQSDKNLNRWSLLNSIRLFQGVKIRLSGIGTPWSGDIPLIGDKGRRNCVLIRVPTKEKGHCTTVWCRLVEETIEPGMTRALLLFSPMYTARSALPNPMRLLVGGSGSSEKGLSYEASLPGRDQLLQVLNCVVDYLSGYKVSL